MCLFCECRVNSNFTSTGKKMCLSVNVMSNEYMSSNFTSTGKNMCLFLNRYYLYKYTKPVDEIAVLVPSRYSIFNPIHPLGRDSDGNVVLSRVSELFLRCNRKMVDLKIWMTC
ncbi:hypothetical protein CEXT_198521 [Caerostris extrusa]|uniref:Uncharacterized protein n=1 Tax=Caerostris extrusa TaxID=172846 RepID=A0AAV4XR62_CAEEX|nr:hypothetical protein CEXT_198521 [Caerostris extrusa]